MSELTDKPEPPEVTESRETVQRGNEQSVFDDDGPTRWSEAAEGSSDASSELLDARKPEIPDGVEMKASELSKWGESQGWRLEQTETGPARYIDENGVARMTLKQGSDRTPGSENPHVEFRDASGQRIDANGNPVNRRSPENHTLIEWDL